MMPAVQEDAKSTEPRARWCKLNFVILTSQKQVAIDEDNESSRFGREELVAATFDPWK